MNARKGNTPVYTGGVADAMKDQARGYPSFYTGGKRDNEEDEEKRGLNGGRRSCAEKIGL